jgi:hypothetical protein
MDRKTNRWGWLPDMMPGVARRLAELRKQHGPEHVELCWQRGVVEGLPGWFFVREGAIAIGTPPTDPEQLAMCGWQVAPTQALVVIKLPEVAHGAH